MKMQLCDFVNIIILILNAYICVCCFLCPTQYGRIFKEQNFHAYI